MKHKYLKHLFTTLLLLCATAVAAHDFEVGGIYYNITDADNKTVGVTYKGYSYSTYSNEYTGDVVIPDNVVYKNVTYSVTSIGKDAFRDCSGLTSVVIGNSVTSFGNSAFRGCTGLTSIIIPNSLASIGDYAFYDCSGLDSAVIPNSVTSIGYSAFDGCIGLVSVEIGNGITNFGNFAFAYCSCLVNITSRIPANSIFAVNTKVFDGVDKTASTLYVPYGAKETYASTAGWSEFANIVELEPEIITGGNCGENVNWTFKDGVLTISGSGEMYDYSFDHKPWRDYNILDIVIEQGVTRIGDFAFSGLGLTASIVIPDNVTSIGNYAFELSDNIKSVTIGKGVTSIGVGAFASCNGITRFVIDSGNPVYDSRDNCNAIIETATNTLIQGFNSTIIPNSVTSIGDFSFLQCVLLTDIVIPAGVTSIGESAFNNCNGLTSVVIPNSVTSIGNDAFSGCGKLTNVVIGNSVTSIGSYAFVSCYGLTSVTIPNSVTSIGYNAFSDCSGLKEVHISDLVAWCNIDFGSLYANPLFCAKNLYLNGELITNLVIPDNVTEIKQFAFSGCSVLTSVEIGNSVESIGEGAFNNCDGLTSVEIGNSVESIGEGAFNNCDGLTSVEIGNSVESIGVSVFEDCSDLTSIVVSKENSVYDSRNDCNAIIETSTNVLIAGCQNTVIPNSVESIGEGAFNNCDGLTSVVIPNSVTSIGNDAFSYCDKLTNVVIGNSVTSIGSYAFVGCYGLTSVTIPNSVTVIGDAAFCLCRGLTSVVIGNSVESIGEKAFSGCSDLTSITSLIPADELFTVVNDEFYSVDKTASTLYVPYGAKETYASTAGWSKFTNIIELEPETTEVTITINQYCAATYCSPYALDFSEVEGLKAYSAIGFNSGTQVVTLARVMTTPAEAGIFVKGEPGEYVVPVIEECNEHTLNLLVGTLEQTTVNRTDGEMSNYKFTVAELDEVPMFYPFEDNTTFSAGKAYLQIPTAWLPATAQKSVSIRFDEGETTDIDEVKGESGEVKTICDLQGRVVENPTSGIYIVNGKKVFIK